MKKDIKHYNLYSQFEESLLRNLERIVMSYPSDLTDGQWELIKAHLIRETMARALDITTRSSVNTVFILSK